MYILYHGYYKLSGLAMSEWEGEEILDLHFLSFGQTAFN